MEGKGRLWGGRPCTWNSWWAIQIPSIANIIWAGMEWLGWSQWHWYSWLFATPIGHFNILSPEYKQLGRTARKIQHIKRIQSPSAGTRQWRALLAEVREKVEKYLCKHFSGNKPRECNWKKDNKKDLDHLEEEIIRCVKSELFWEKTELSLEKVCKKKKEDLRVEVQMFSPEVWRRQGPARCQRRDVDHGKIKYLLKIKRNTNAVRGHEIFQFVPVLHTWREMSCSCSLSGHYLIITDSYSALSSNQRVWAIKLATKSINLCVTSE